MKRYVVLLAALTAFAFVESAHAVNVQEDPLDRTVSATVGTSISTSAWTKVNTATSQLNNRSGYRVNNKDSNSADMGCTLSIAAPTQAITIYDIEIPDGSNLFIPAGPNLNLYCVSLHTAAETLWLREYGQ